MLSSKERRQALRSSHDPSWRADSHNINSVNSSLEEWLLARNKIGENTLLPVLTLVSRLVKSSECLLLSAQNLMFFFLLHYIQIGK
jgi:hypothetical protein